MRSRQRLILLAVIAAVFALVPAAQALAAPATVTITVEGSGSGKITPVEPGYYSGEPTVECEYASPGPATGTCVTEMNDEGEGLEGVFVEAAPDPGSELVEWKVEEGEELGCSVSPPKCLLGYFELETHSTAKLTAVINASPSPTITSLSPNHGPEAGSEFVDIFGSGLYGAEEVQFGPTTIASSEFIGEVFPGHIRIPAPPGSGAVEVTVTTPVGTSAPASYTYDPAGPTVTTLIPSKGPEAGGNTVAVEGTGLEGATEVTFGANPATITSDTTTKIEVEAPAGSGTVDVTVTTPSGTSDKTSADQYTYLANPATLSLFKGGNGSGTVTSNPAGINCGTEPCEATYEEGEVITLTAAAATGSAFAGWIGCHPVAGETTKCNVTLGGPEVDVTAVFMAEGVPGQAGESPAVTILPIGDAHCPQGGTEFTLASTHAYACNGASGTNGSNGSNGETPTVTALPIGNAHCPQGGQEFTLGSTHAYACNGTNGAGGADGSDGTNGTNGSNGTNGKDGATGPTGPVGPQGAQGPKGPAAKVTCKVKGKTKVKVTCTVKQSASASSSSVKWRLMRANRTYRHGRTTAKRLSLDVSNLRPGRYVLHFQGQKGSQLIVVS